MTVTELIAALQRIDGDLPVYVAGKEGGVHDVTDLLEAHIQRDANDPDEHWYGRHKVLHQGPVNGVEIYGR